MGNRPLELKTNQLDQVTIRPITRDDLELERYFYEHLSPQAKHYRFMGGINQLTDEELEELCDIDFGNHMAFIATVITDGEERLVGVSRYALDVTGEAHEFVVTIADEWQQKGLGTLLMKKLIEFAKAHDVKKLYAIELADNILMKKLADALGMKRQRDPEVGHQVIYSLAL